MPAIPRPARTAALALAMAAAWFVAEAPAEPILFTTAGTVAPPGAAASLAGLADEPFDAPLPFPSPTDGRSSFNLGRVAASPGLRIAPPSFDRATFAIKMSFNVPYLPALEFKGVFRGDGGEGAATSVTSLDPGLNGNLNPTFAALLSSPSNLRVGLTPQADGRSRLTATVLPSAVFGVPEPSTAALLVAGGALLALARRRIARDRAAPRDSSGPI